MRYFLLFIMGFGSLVFMHAQEFSPQVKPFISVDEPLIAIDSAKLFESVQGKVGLH